VSSVILANLMVVQVASRILELGGADTAIADWSYRLTMVGAAAAVTARAVTVRDQRLAWSLVAAGLAAWTAGDFYYFLVLAGGTIPYPSAADGLYLALYGFVIVGLNLLRGRTPLSLGLVVTLLAVATVWSWLVFRHVVESAGGRTVAVATTLAYPLLDLVLVASVVLALASRGFRANRMLWLLAAGFLSMAVGDSVYATQVVQGTYVDGTLVEVLWPAGALCVAAAAWTRRPAVAVDRPGSGRVAEVLTGIGIAIGVLTLFVDHFERVDTVTLALAGATLLAALLQRLVIYRERAEAQRAATAAATLRRAALDCIISFDGYGIVTEWNDASVKTFGYGCEKALGADLAELVIPPSGRESHRRALAQMGKGENDPFLNRRIERVMMRADGTEFPSELVVVQVNLAPPRFTAFLRDISERRQRDEENERLAALVQSSNSAIISKDLNGTVIDWNAQAVRLYGYTKEEALGRTLSDLIIPTDRADEMQAVTDSVVAGEVRTFETKRRRKDGTVIDISLRAFPIRDATGEIIGVCTSAHDVTERLRAEEAERRDREGRLWRGRVRTALDEGNFMFWGQPVVDAATGAVDHHELLLRMDLDGSVITPNHFLPHAENCDLMIDIDRFAIATGLEFAATTPVAINISARGIDDRRLIDHIERCLVDETVARNVVFEITETAAVANLDAAADLVTELTALGFRVALDDFGTGYGSFNYLRRLSLTELKIDIEYVRALAENPADQRLVKSLVAVAQTFGMKTVAEGVEDEETAGLLRELGVDLLQGYYVGYPAQMTLSSRWSSPQVDIRTGPLASHLGRPAQTSRPV
jgi:PAS domain S-box-containing protein